MRWNYYVKKDGRVGYWSPLAYYMVGDDKLLAFIESDEMPTQSPMQQLPLAQQSTEKP